MSGEPSLFKFGLAVASPSFFIFHSAMANHNTIGPVDAPWDAPDPLTSVRQLQSLVGLGFNVGHDSAGDLQAIVQSAMGGIRKEVEQHMDYLHTEHVEHKTDHQIQRKMVRVWKCSSVALQATKTFFPEDADQDSSQIYYQWNKMNNFPGWWVKKVWTSEDGWLLVAKKEEFSLLIIDPPPQLDQRHLVEEVICTDSCIDSQKQSMAATLQL